jgi:hypothetical protein
MTTTDTGAVRCSTAERESVAARLHEAAGEGRLTMDEVEERLTAVYAARHQHELDALTADLPKADAEWRATATRLWSAVLAQLMVLLGRAPAGSQRHRMLVALTAITVLVILGGIAALMIDGLTDGGGPHGVGGPGFEH